MEGLDHQFLFVPHVLKDLLLEDKKSAVDAHAAVVNGVDPGNQAAIARFQRHQVIAEIRADAQKAGYLVLLVKVLQLLRKRKVGKAVAVVGQKFLFALQILLHHLQAHPDVGIDSGIGEGNAPIVDITVQQFKILGAARQDKVVRGAFVVVEEVVLDGIGAMPQAENKVLVAEVGVVLHDMPQDGPVADMHHGLGQIFGVADPHALPAAK